jgi:septum formation protein
MAVPRLILASRSKSRASMLKNVGLPFEAIPAQIDEAEFLKQMKESGYAPKDVAINLAEQKALSISKERAHNIVIGSDQILVFENEIITKVESRQQAIDKLKKLRGKTHTLISAVCLAKDGEVVWDAYDAAHLTMHDFDDQFLKEYVESAGSALTDCVGCYALEEHGAWLFSKVEGDFFTILGMPLLPLMGFLKDMGFRP